MKLTRYQATYNPILEYWQAIQDGREVVSLKVQKTYRHVVAQLENADSEFYYSPRRANHVLEFFENYCHHSKGKAGGQLVKLELWEKALLATAPEKPASRTYSAVLASMTAANSNMNQALGIKNIAASTNGNNIRAVMMRCLSIGTAPDLVSGFTVTAFT